jgi:hypothetical protein
MNKDAAPAQLKLKFGQVRGAALRLCNLRHGPEINSLRLARTKRWSVMN